MTRIEAFIEALRSERRSPDTTIRAYTAHLAVFDAFIRRDGRARAPQWRRITASDVRGFVVARNEAGDSPATVAARLAAVKSFFAWADEVGVVQGNPASGVHAPKNPKRLPDTITADDAARLIAAATGRDKALVTLLYGSGLRVGEAVGANVGDVDLDAGSITVIGKRDKQRRVPITDEAVAAIREYVPESTELGRPLFLSDDGTRLSGQGASSVVTRLGASIGLGISAHTLRHACATHLIEGGAGIAQVQRLLGHSSITTTQIYVHVTDEALRDMVRKAHPRAAA